jgi:uncharacterized protein (UPF0261 family)
MGWDSWSGMGFAPPLGGPRMKTVVVAGAFDTKGADYGFFVERIRSHGVTAFTVDFGVLVDPAFRPDVTSAEVARAGGAELSALRQSGDVLAPGCVDMCNFGPRDSVPGKYGGRVLYEWNANVTLMRTNIEENRRIGGLIAETANRCAGPVAVLLPLGGLSMLDSPSGPFWDAEADHACFDAIRSRAKQGAPVIEVNCNINDPIVADRATEAFLRLSKAPGVTASGGAAS